MDANLVTFRFECKIASGFRLNLNETKFPDNVRIVGELLFKL